MRRLLASALALSAALVAGLVAAPAHAATAAGSTEIRFVALAFEGRGGADAMTVGSGATFLLRPQLRWQYFGSRPSMPHLRLQRHDATGWRTVPASVRLPDDLSDGSPLVRVRPHRPAHAVDRVRYRLVSARYHDGRGEVVNTAVSKPVTVRYEDQRRYTGLAREAWRAIRPYCPSTAVHTAPLTGERAGDYSTGSGLVRIDSAVRGHSSREIRTIALHECAHQRQWLNYGGTSAGWQRMERAAARVYTNEPVPDGVHPTYLTGPAADPFVPLEHGADCAAVSVEPHGYLGYGGYCSSRELREGRALLHGHRY